MSSLLHDVDSGESLQIAVNAHVSVASAALPAPRPARPCAARPARPARQSVAGFPARAGAAANASDCCRCWARARLYVLLARWRSTSPWRSNRSSKVRMPKLPQQRLADLPFDPPHVLADAIPERKEPRLVTLLLDLCHLVVDAEHNVIAPEGQRLNLAAFTMLGVLAGNRDEVRSRRSHARVSDSRTPSPPAILTLAAPRPSRHPWPNQGIAPADAWREVAPQRLAAEGDEEGRPVELAALDLVIRRGQDQRVSGSAAVRLQ